MTEAYVLPIPADDAELTELEDQTASSYDVSTSPIEHAANYALDLLVPDTEPSRKEKFITMGALGAVGIGSTIAQYGYARYFNHSPQPIKFWEGSGRHFLVGYIGASIASSRRKSNSLGGMLLGAAAADIATEAAQSAIITGAVHHGWNHVDQFAQEKQWEWDNSLDFAASLMAGVGFRTRLWMIERKRRKQEQNS